MGINSEQIPPQRINTYDQKPNKKQSTSLAIREMQSKQKRY